MEPSDESLVRACRNGDAVAWEQLVRRYQRLVYAVPRRAGLDDDLAAEVFQRVFATLVEKLDGIEQPGRIAAWLVTTAKRESWRVSRRARTTEPLPQLSGEDDTEAELPDDGPLPEEQLLRLERQHHVRSALDSLDDRCRELLTMLFYQPEPPAYTEIAAALGTSVGSIGPTRARCLQKLRALIDPTLL